MNPIYAQLRRRLPAGDDVGESSATAGRINLERARALPAGSGRYVVVNSAAQRLFMYEDGEVVDSMRVVVGKPNYPTPMMAAYDPLRGLNPYWYVPPDLAAERIAPNVVKQGVGYLDRLGYQVVSRLGRRSDDRRSVDDRLASGCRWAAKVLIRQQPGPHNCDGPDEVHVPQRAGHLPARQSRAGAVRARRRGCTAAAACGSRMRRGSAAGCSAGSSTWKGAGAEEKVPLDKPVPVYLTYLTAVPNGSDDRLSRRRLRPRCGALANADGCRGAGRCHASLSGDQSGYQVMSCATGRPSASRRRPEAHIVRPSARR